MADPAAPGGRVMAVRTELVKEFLVGRIHTIVVERHTEQLPPETEAALTRSAAKLFDPPLREVEARLVARIARAGYLARVAEHELFERAREPTAVLADQARGLVAEALTPEDALSLSVRLALAEPVARPDPHDERAITWRIPGPGGHVRHYVALASIAWALEDESGGPSGELNSEWLKRCWLCGFFLRSCEEVPPNAGS